MLEGVRVLGDGEPHGPAPPWREHGVEEGEEVVVAQNRRHVGWELLVERPHELEHETGRRPLVDVVPQEDEGGARPPGPPPGRRRKVHETRARHPGPGAAHVAVQVPDEVDVGQVLVEDPQAGLLLLLMNLLQLLLLVTAVVVLPVSAGSPQEGTLHQQPENGHLPAGAGSLCRRDACTHLGRPT